MTASTPEVVQALFSSAGLPQTVDDVAALSGGEISQVFEVRCGGPDRVLVLKLYPDDLRWKMAKEAFVYGLIGEGSGLPTPRILFADDSGGTIPEAYLIMTKLPGTLASSAMPSLSEREVARIYEQAGSILRGFHRITFDSFGYLWTGVVEPHGSNVAYMEHQFAKKIREFGDLGGDATIRRRTERVVEAATPLLNTCMQAVLCHDDLHEGNLLVQEREEGWQISGVLDVENAVAGDPLLDLAKTDYYAVRGDPAKRRALFEGYGPLPQEAEETMRVYRLYHALELWDWCASIGNEEPLGSIAEDIRTYAR